MFKLALLISVGVLLLCSGALLVYLVGPGVTPSKKVLKFIDMLYYIALGIAVSTFVYGLFRGGFSSHVPS